MEEKQRKKLLIINIVFVILIVLFCISVTQKVLQNDTYYTIKIGEYIKTHGIDMKDPFSWHKDLNYTYPHWLYDLIIYFVYFIAGFDGIYIFTCILSVILGISVYYINSKLAKNNLISLVITIGVMYLLRDYIAARAQLVTFILFIWEIYCIEKFIENKKIRYVFGLILISLLIANVHSAVWPLYFVLYLPYIGEYIISVLADVFLYHEFKYYILKKKINKANKKKKIEKVQQLEMKLQKLEEHIEKVKIKRKNEKNNIYKVNLERKPNVKFLIVILLICILTGLLTPIKDTPYTYLIKTLQGNTTQNINEHLPMTLVNHKDILSTFIIFLTILIFTKTKIKMNDLFMLGGLLFLMLLSRRQASIFALICGIILNKMLFELIYLNNKNKLNINNALSILNIGIISVVIILLSVNFMLPKLKKEYVDKSIYPVEASDWILEHLDLNNLRMYNEYNYGSYLLFKGIPVFIDSRADLYAPEFNTTTGNKEDGKDIFSDFLNCSNIGDYYGDTFKKYNMNYVMTYKNSKVNMLIEKSGGNKYILNYIDDNFVIYEINNTEE